MKSVVRQPKDDFFCWKFRVWYNLRDCVFRHCYETTVECASCKQGASNTMLIGRAPAPPRFVKILTEERPSRSARR